MYDELVERLRSGRYTLEDLSIILPEAADAIEKLSKRINRAIELYNRNVEKTAIYEALMGISPEPPKGE